MVRSGTRVFIEYDRFRALMEDLAAQDGAQDSVTPQEQDTAFAVASHGDDYHTADGQAFQPDEVRAYLTVFHADPIGAKLANVTEQAFADLPEGIPSRIAPLAARHFGLDNRYRIFKGQSPIGDPVFPLITDFPMHEEMHCLAFNGDPGSDHDDRHPTNMREFQPWHEFMGIPVENCTYIDAAKALPGSYDASIEGIRAAFDEVAQRMSNRDGLWIYGTGHGDLVSEAGRGDVSQFVIPDGHYSSTALISSVKAMQMASVTALFDQCFSSEIVRELVKEVGESREALGMAPNTDKVTTRCQDFIPHVREAFERGYDLDGDPVVTRFVEDALRWGLIQYNLKSSETIYGAVQRSFAPLTHNTLDMARQQSGPVVIQLSAPWCVACESVEKNFEAIRNHVGGAVATYKVFDVGTEDGKRVVKSLEQSDARISGAALPTFLYFHDGELRGRRVGSASIEEFREDLAAYFDIEEDPRMMHRTMAQQLSLQYGVPEQFTMSILLAQPETHAKRIALNYWTTHAKTPEQFVRVADELLTHKKSLGFEWLRDVGGQAWTDVTAQNRRLQLLGKFGENDSESVDVVMQQLRHDNPVVRAGALLATAYFSADRLQRWQNTEAGFHARTYLSYVNNADAAPVLRDAALTAMVRWRSSGVVREAAKDANAHTAMLVPEADAALAEHVSAGLRSAEPTLQNGALTHLVALSSLDEGVSTELWALVPELSLRESEQTKLIQQAADSSDVRKHLTRTPTLQEYFARMLSDAMERGGVARTEALKVHVAERGKHPLMYVGGNRQKPEAAAAWSVVQDASNSEQDLELALKIIHVPYEASTATAINGLLRHSSPGVVTAMARQLDMKSIHMHNKPMLRHVMRSSLQHNNARLRYTALRFMVEDREVATADKAQVLRERFAEDADAGIRAYAFTQLYRILEGSYEQAELVQTGLEDSSAYVAGRAVEKISATQQEQLWSRLEELELLKSPAKLGGVIKKLYSMRGGARFMQNRNAFAAALWTWAGDDVEARRAIVSGLRSSRRKLQRRDVDEHFPLSQQEMLKSPQLALNYHQLRFRAAGSHALTVQGQEALVKAWETGIPRVQRWAMRTAMPAVKDALWKNPERTRVALTDRVLSYVAQGSGDVEMERACVAYLHTYYSVFDPKKNLYDMEKPLLAVLQRSQDSEVLYMLMGALNQSLRMSPRAMEVAKTHLEHPDAREHAVSFMGDYVRARGGKRHEAFRGVWPRVKFALAHDRGYVVAAALRVLRASPDASDAERAAMIHQYHDHPFSDVRRAIQEMAKGIGPEYRAEVEALVPEQDEKRTKAK